MSIGTPENVITGITIKKDKELRDRLIRIMERREEEKPEDFSYWLGEALSQD